jgi:hypothetical protein
MHSTFFGSSGISGMSVSSTSEVKEEEEEEEEEEETLGGRTELETDPLLPEMIELGGRLIELKELELLRESPEI